MARGVDEIQQVFVPIIGLVVECDGVAFDRDAALSLDVHRVKHLVMKVALGDAITGLDKSVGKGGLAVINMSDNAKVANVFHAEFQVIDVAARRPLDKSNPPF